MASYDDLRYEQMPWIEKFRPWRLKDIILTPELKNKFKSFVHNKSIPNLMFSGTPGNGKTTTIRAIAHEIYGDKYDEYVLELNASDERGIKSTKVINFCKMRSVDENMHKLIVFDEADNMMENAQHQLNTLMEQYKDTIRFAFTCNTSSDVIEAIQSKCVSLNYTSLTVNQIVERINDICRIEKITCNKEGVKLIAELSRGDMREAINKLQLVFNKFGSITDENVKTICDFPQPVIINEMFMACLNDKLVDAIKLLGDLKHNGYSGSDIILGMNYTIKSDICDTLPMHVKIGILDKVSKAAFSVSEGLDSTLQLVGCLGEISIIKA